MDNNHTQKHYFDMSGLTFTEVKVEFDYLCLDSWDSEIGWLAIKLLEASVPNPIWYTRNNNSWRDIEVNGVTYEFSFYGNSSYSDTRQRSIAVFPRTNNFWLEFGANLNGPVSDETFGIDNIFIYVR